MGHAREALGRRASSMQIHDRADDREPEAGGIRRVGARLIRPIEPLENLRDVLRGDTGSLYVADGLSAHHRRRVFQESIYLKGSFS